MPTPSVILRELELADATAIAPLANNKKIWDNVRNRMPYPYSESDAVDFISLATKEDGPTIRAITEEGVLVGLIGLHPGEDVYSGTAELGYWIGEPFWGRGLASAAVEKILRLGFEELQLRRIHADVFEPNLASMRVLEKNGFVREGVAQGAVMKNGKVLDEVKFGIINPGVF